jgi:shikimate dehydrogenase
MTPSTAIRQCAVIGNPIEHSRSPFIHEQFARQLGIALHYEKIKAPLDGFDATAQAFFSRGGIGLNVTTPFKEQACALARANLSDRARMAGAVNTLWMEHGRVHGCNTDGVGLLDDIQRLGITPENKKILVVGAGGAAKGLMFPLLNARCAQLCVVNRNPQRALQLREHIIGLAPQAGPRLSAGSLGQATGQWDIVINATSSSLTQQAPDLPAAIYAPGALAYDLMYAAQPTPFMRQALAQGAQHSADGLGMLVAQAAASFMIWHRRQPDIVPVLAALRQQLSPPLP